MNGGDISELRKEVAELRRETKQVKDNLDEHMGGATDRADSASWVARWGWGTAITISGVVLLLEHERLMDETISMGLLLSAAIIVVGIILLLSSTLKGWLLKRWSKGMRPLPIAEISEKNGDKHVRFVEGMTVSDAEKHKLNLGWSNLRIGLLGIWMTIYLSAFFTVRSGSNSFAWGVTSAAASALFGLFVVAFFRNDSMRNGFFAFFDWIGRERGPSVRTFAVVIALAVFLLISLSIFLAIG